MTLSIRPLTLFGEERKYPDEKKVRWEKVFK
jgi:hypothetical protein